jgi:hypothetical protein
MISCEVRSFTREFRGEAGDSAFVLEQFHLSFGWGRSVLDEVSRIDDDPVHVQLAVGSHGVAVR